jgi:hypothetical protein
VTGYQRIVITKGATWETDIEVQDEVGDPMVLTGASAAMQIRATLDNPAVLLELTTGNGRIEIAGPGALVLLLTAEETAAQGWDHGVYDLRMTIADQVSVLLRGEILIDPVVTR